MTAQEKTAVALTVRFLCLLLAGQAYNQGQIHDNSIDQELVIDTDQQRTRFLKTYFHDDGTRPELYDLVIDTSHIDPHAVVGMVEVALESRGLVSATAAK